MLLTIATTHRPATDLGYLLHKNPANVHTFELSFGQCHVFYPQASETECTAALLLEIDPVQLVRGKEKSAWASKNLEHYVNDRPYVASSYLSVAIAETYGTALSGRCKSRPELVETAIPLRASVASLPCRGGEALLRKLFEPLGYAVEVGNEPLDETFPDWGDSRYFNLTLTGTLRLSELLSHLYVLIPVLDNQKHYFMNKDELDKLLRHGEGWLAGHPEKEFITRRYLMRRGHLIREAIARLSEAGEEDVEAAEERVIRQEEELEKPISLNDQRIGTVLSVLKSRQPKTVVDLGCGEGRLLRELIQDRSFERVAGMDVSYRALEMAGSRLKLDRMTERQRERVELFQGSLTYQDKRLKQYDAATVIEVIEHLDPDRLQAFERAVFGFARPETVVVTTPNVEYNVRFETLPPGKLRHSDHRFEWTRTEFETWARDVAERHGYSVRFLAIGPEDEQVGSPTQMGVFSR